MRNVEIILGLIAGIQAIGSIWMAYRDLFMMKHSQSVSEIRKVYSDDLAVVRYNAAQCKEESDLWKLKCAQLELELVANKK